MYSDPKEAGSTLAIINDGKLLPIKSPYSSFGSLSFAKVGSKVAVATVGGSPTRPSEAAVLMADSVDGLLTADASQWHTLRKSTSVEVHHLCAMQLMDC